MTQKQRPCQSTSPVWNSIDKRSIVLALFFYGLAGISLKGKLRVFFSVIKNTF
jgi:hypothetical protein